MTRSSTNAYHDESGVPTLIAASSVDGQTPVLLWADPTTHRLLVDSTGGGGGGFTTLAPTETPNGSLTVFTFLTATSQPTFIISDNVMMQATTKSGTVNWTWNNGTKKATMTIPPNDDIIGIQ